MLNIDVVKNYVENNIGVFHSKRIESVDKLKLSKVLAKKNPYLFKAKNVQTSAEIVSSIVNAFISSNEETIFGDWLEGLAIFINHQVFGGRKSGIPGIDLEFEKDDIKYIVNIKSGPNWGNASQISKLKSDFLTAKKTLRTSNSKLNVIAINGCCYGRDNNPDKGEYFKYCGQKFWEFISGDNELYIELIKPLSHRAKEHNEEYQLSYSHLLNRFIREFSLDYCLDNGEIDWKKLIQFNSSDSNSIL